MRHEFHSTVQTGRIPHRIDPRRRAGDRVGETLKGGEAGRTEVCRASVRASDAQAGAVNWRDELARDAERRAAIEEDHAPPDEPAEVELELDMLRDRVDNPTEIG